MATHIVKSSDTLSSIARKYNTTIAELQKLNADKIKNVDLIIDGWVLKVPDPAPAEPSKDYNAIGKQVEKVLEDIQRLRSFNELMELIK